MSLDDIFRSFFGFNRHNRSAPRPPEYDNFEGEDPTSNPQDGEFHFHFGDTDAMMRHFDEMFKGFDEAFRSMGISEFPRGHPEDFAAIGPPEAPLRDRMLKIPDSDKEIPQYQLPQEDRQPGAFSGFWSRQRPNLVSPHEKVDKDLDNQIGKENLDQILSESRSHSKPHHLQQEPGFRSRLSVRTYRNIDGQVEEHSTVRDSEGNEHKTVTRRIGDQAQSVVTHQYKDGSVDTEEVLTNLDEKDKDSFTKLWDSNPQSRNPSVSGGSQQPDLDLYGPLVPRDEHYDQQTQSIFKNLFGFNFPGFGRS